MISGLAKGKSQNSATMSGSLATLTTFAFTTTHCWTSESDSAWFTGNIDDVRIYNHALSDSEVQQLYQISQVPFSDGLVAYYPFNGNANDASGHGHNGTNYSGVLVPDRFGY